MDAKFCIIEKTLHFTHFDLKNTHICGCKIMHLCTSAIVTVHICTVTVACIFNILHFFLSPSPHSLIFSFSLSPLSHFISSPSVYRSIQPHSHRSPISLASRSPISSVLPLMSELQRCHWWTKKQAMPPLLSSCRRQSPPKLTRQYDLRNSLIDMISLTFDPF